MAGKRQRSESSRAGVGDISDYGDKDIASAYPPGTMFDLGDGGPPVDVSAVPDHVGGVVKKPAVGRKRAPTAPSRDGS